MELASERSSGAGRGLGVGSGLVCGCDELVIIPGYSRECVSGAAVD